MQRAQGLGLRQMKGGAQVLPNLRVSVLCLEARPYVSKAAGLHHSRIHQRSHPLGVLCVLTGVVDDSQVAVQLLTHLRREREINYTV